MADYFVDGEDVLENKLGITDARELKAAEQDIVTNNTVSLLNAAVTTFDFAFLLHVHRVLFHNIYDFAGQVRTVDIAKPDAKAPFAYAQLIGAESMRIFNNLSGANYFVELNKRDFVKKITLLAAELNALHPFREGNGRSIRLFLILLADHAGYLLDYSLVSSEELISADKLAFEGNMEPLFAMYKKVTVELYDSSTEHEKL